MKYLQRDLELIRTYKAENNGMYDYNLSIQGEPVKAEHSANTYDFGLVNIADSGNVHLEMYKNSESVPSMDLQDENSFIVPVKIN